MRISDKIGTGGRNPRGIPEQPRARTRTATRTRTISRKGNVRERKCYNYDKHNFTRDHLNECAAKGATCNFCKKVGHFEHTCRAKRNNRGRQSVGIIQGQDDQYHYEQEDIDETVRESSVGWVNTPAPPKQHHSWDSDSLGDYLVMSIRSKNRTALKAAGAKLPIAINGRKTSVWIDSGSPRSIFTIGELRKTLGTNGVTPH